MANDNKVKVTFHRVTNSQLNSLAIRDGQLIFVQDTGAMYIDVVLSGQPTRIPVQNVITGLGELAYKSAIDTSYINDGTLPLSRGGLGANEFAEGEVLIGNGTTSIETIGIDNTPGGSEDSEDLISSGAVYEGLLTKLDSSLKGANNGLAELGNDGKILSAQLPESANAIEEYNSRGSFPVSGEAHKIYVDTSTNRMYRWDGSQYVDFNFTSSSWYIEPYTDPNGNAGLGFFMV